MRGPASLHSVLNYNFLIIVWVQASWCPYIIGKNWEEGPSSSKNEIQYVLDLSAKLHTCYRYKNGNPGKPRCVIGPLDYGNLQRESKCSFWYSHQL